MSKPSTDIRNRKISDLLDWMIDGARPAGNAPAIIESICTRLIDAGINVDRFGLFIWTLHPNLSGRRFIWKKGEGLDRVDAPRGLFATQIYTDNPLPHVIERQQSIRRHLEDPDCPEDYIIVGELRAQGFTDYIAQPLIYITGETHVCTWSCATPGGFSDDDIAVLERLRAPMARLTETYLLRLDAATLLSTYVGRNSGHNILEGQVHRGDGEEISAVILFADLKGFTALSNQIEGTELVNLLNDTFDCLVPGIMEEGGEILKFMGDGFFAVFPTPGGEDRGEKARAACRAIQKGRVTLAEADIGSKVGFRSAIHHGTFHYGNIGGGDRLDYTAIGPAINLTARLLEAATTLGQDDVVSADVAAQIKGSCDQIGTVDLKGFDTPQEVWTCSEIP